MKKLISALLIFAIVLVSLSVTAFAANPQLTVTNVQGLPGDTVKVTVSIKNNPGFGGMAFDLNYDNSVLDVVSYVKGIGSDICVDSENIYPDKINFQYAGLNNQTGDGALVTVDFKIKSNAPTGSSRVSVVPQPGSTFYYNGRTEVDFSLSAATGYVTVNVTGTPQKITISEVYDESFNDSSIAVVETKLPTGNGTKKITVNGDELFYSVERGVYVGLIMNSALSGTSTNAIISDVAPTKFVYGNVDGDNDYDSIEEAVDSSDLQVLKRFVKGSASISPVCMISAELDGDGLCDSSDLQSMKLRLKRKKPFPIFSK